MIYFKLFELLTILCIINKTTALKCWCCLSDEMDSEFCGKVLDETTLTRYQKDVNLVDCTYPHFESKRRNLITKCMMQRTTSNGRVVYSRSCVWEESNAEKDACLNQSPGFGYRVEACETCLEDKCNYRLASESQEGRNGATVHLMTFYKIAFVCLVIVLII